MTSDFPTLQSNGTEEPVLKSVRIDGSLEGLLLCLSVRQVFRNESSVNMEVIYTFPLPWGAVLLSLEATLAEKRLKGNVLARHEARERYEDAVEQGDAPVMVEKARGNMFSACLGSLRPGEEAVLELHTAHMLSFEMDRIRLVVPTTVAPRYGDGSTQAGLSPDQVATPTLSVEHPFGLSLTLHGRAAQAKIGSPSHRIKQQSYGSNLKIELQDRAWLDRDFILLLEGLEGVSFAIASQDERSGPGHAAVIASFCPRVSPQDPLPLRLKILLDCSGSMAGDSISQAREALRPLAALLQASDQLAFIRFGSQTHRILDAVNATPANIQLFLQAINTTEADLGGTEMASALRECFSLPMDPACGSDEADVLLITDGAVWDAERLVEDARRSGHRIHALGVGSAPSESLLREMAEATGGACEFAAPSEDMDSAIQRLLNRIQMTVPLQARLKQSTVPLWSSPQPRRLAPNETVHLYMRLPNLPTQAPQLVVSGEASSDAELTIRQDDLVARLVAAQEIGYMTDRDAASQVAQTYQLVTEETNLLLVFERAEAEKTDGMPVLHKEHPMLAAGWGGTATLRRGEPQSLQRLQSLSGSRQSAMRQGTDRLSIGDSVRASVWRTKTLSGVDSSGRNLALDIDDFEIPAFLRKASSAVSESIIRTFNQAVAQGLGYRQAVRQITALNPPKDLLDRIAAASIHAGSLLKAWACQLLWLHQSGNPSLMLSAEALAMVRDQLKELDAVALDEARGVGCCRFR